MFIKEVITLFITLFFIRYLKHYNDTERRKFLFTTDGTHIKKNVIKSISNASWNNNNKLFVTYLGSGFDLDFILHIYYSYTSNEEETIVTEYIKDSIVKHIYETEKVHILNSDIKVMLLKEISI